MAARSLKNKFISELAKRNDWQGLVSYSTTVPKPVSAKCDYYYANWQTGNRQVALDGAKSVWLAGNSLPSSCDKLFDVWDQSGGLTPERVLERISLALKKMFDIRVKETITPHIMIKKLICFVVIIAGVVMVAL